MWPGIAWRGLLIKCLSSVGWWSVSWEFRLVVIGVNIAMAKADEFREMSDEQIQLTLKEMQENLFRLRFQAETERLDAPSELRKSRRDVARLKTVVRERELSELNSDQKKP